VWSEFVQVRTLEIGFPGGVVLRLSGDSLLQISGTLCPRIFPDNADLTMSSFPTLDLQWLPTALRMKSKLRVLAFQVFFHCVIACCSLCLCHNVPSTFYLSVLWHP
jgi:hypothetical protein